MHKVYSQNNLLSMNSEKQFKVLLELASFIEKNVQTTDADHYERLVSYHHILSGTRDNRMIRLNREFQKLPQKKIGRQFQVYIMTLERFMGQSKKEYEFLVPRGDKASKEVKLIPVICLLDSVRSAHNIGAMFRNADCFSIQEIIICGLSPTPDHNQVKKTAMACDETVNWSYQRHASTHLEILKKEGYKIWAVEQTKNSVNINKISEVPKKLVLVFGHEQYGVSFEILKFADKTIFIELFGKKNSLNVSVCQAITLHKIAPLY